MRFIDFIKKNKSLLIFLSVILLIAILLGIIYYLNIANPNDKRFLTSSNLKGYDVLKQKTSTLQHDPAIKGSPDLGKFISKLNLLEDKNLSDEKKYETLRDAFERLTSLYSLTNNPKVNDVIKEMGPFAKQNFSKYYKEFHFVYYCQDEKCAENPMPSEILAMVDEINTSDMPSAVKHAASTNLINTGYLSEKDKDQIINSFLITYVMLRDGTDFSKTGANTKIANKIFTYIQKRYPEDMKKILNSPQAKSTGLMK